MKKLPVLTYKNNHALISKAIPLLITSLILASTFIVTSLPFAQSAPYDTPAPQTNDKGITFNFTIGGKFQTQIKMAGAHQGWIARPSNAQCIITPRASRRSSSLLALAMAVT